MSSISIVSHEQLYDYLKKANWRNEYGGITVSPCCNHYVNMSCGPLPEEWVN